MPSLKRQSGATLIELIVSMVIISISVTAIMMVVVNTTRNSADPMIRVQATSIADAYLEEILSQSLLDPSGGDVGGPEAGEVRATFDDVNDYAGLNDASGALDQQGNPISGLEGYNVTVSVASTPLAGNAATRILVSVSHDANPAVTLNLSTYRLN